VHICGCKQQVNRSCCGADQSEAFIISRFTVYISDAVVVAFPWLPKEFVLPVLITEVLARLRDASDKLDKSPLDKFDLQDKLRRNLSKCII